MAKKMNNIPTGVHLAMLPIKVDVTVTCILVLSIPLRDYIHLLAMCNEFCLILEIVLHFTKKCLM